MGTRASTWKYASGDTVMLIFPNTGNTYLARVLQNGVTMDGISEKGYKMYVERALILPAPDASLSSLPRTTVLRSGYLHDLAPGDVARAMAI